MVTQASLMMWLGALMVVMAMVSLFLPKKWFDWSPEGRFFLFVGLVAVGSSFLLGKGC